MRRNGSGIYKQSYEGLKTQEIKEAEKLKKEAKYKFIQGDYTERNETAVKDGRRKKQLRIKQKNLEAELQLRKQVDLKIVFCEGKHCFREAPTSNKQNKKGEPEKCRENFIDYSRKECFIKYNVQPEIKE